MLGLTVCMYNFCRRLPSHEMKLEAHRDSCGGNRLYRSRIIREG